MILGVAGQAVVCDTRGQVKVNSPCRTRVVFDLLIPFVAPQTKAQVEAQVIFLGQDVSHGNQDLWHREEVFVVSNLHVNA